MESATCGRYFFSTAVRAFSVSLFMPCVRVYHSTLTSLSEKEGFRTSVSKNATLSVSTVFAISHLLACCGPRSGTKVLRVIQMGFKELNAPSQSGSSKFDKDL